VIEGVSDSCLAIENNVLDQLEVQGDYLEGAIKLSIFSLQCFRDLAALIRDNFYLPLHSRHCEPYFANNGAYATQFVEMLKGNNPHLDPTFPNLPQMIDHFVIRDVPIKVKLEIGDYTFLTRVIESKESIEGKKLRFVLFSFYHHIDEKDAPWKPLTTDEMSCAALEVLKAYGQTTKIHSMMTFSLGALILDSLKNVALEESHIIPKTLIINRGLASIWKVLNQYYSMPASYFLYTAISHLGLDADPENEILSFFKRMQVHSPQSLEGRKVVILETKHDTYFSEKGDFESDFRENLEETGAEAYHASFFVPMIAGESHHSVRMDMLINNKESGTVSANFLSAKENQNLPSTLVQNLLSETDEKGYHNIFITGGNIDTLDSIAYLQAAPLMSAFVELKEP
jgi:hypothetical protein